MILPVKKSLSWVGVNKGRAGTENGQAENEIYNNF